MKLKNTVTFFLIFLICACEKGPDYSPEYQTANTGKVSFEIPEVLELSQIAISLTNYEDKNRNGQYWTDVEAYFGKYRSHPLITKLKNEVKNINVDYDIRMGAFAHEFDKDGNIIAGFYPYSKFGDGKNRFKDLIAEFQDFSKVSDFRTFYKNQKNKYDFLIKKQSEVMPIREMWDWLENRFDDKSESYKVIFSPLIGGNHNTVWFPSKKGFRESIFFISYVGESNQNQGLNVKKGLASRIVFTEIDHNYVNPVSDKNEKEIKKAFKDLKKWNNSSQGYNSEILTFNEYMTWAVFTLYAYEKYPKEDFEKINQLTEDVMIKNRGFKKYKEFNQYLLSEFIKNKEMKSKEIFKLALEWSLKN